MSAPCEYCARERPATLGEPRSCCRPGADVDRLHHALFRLYAAVMERATGSACARERQGAIAEAHMVLWP